jgi:hypothetical protein
MMELPIVTEERDQALTLGGGASIETLSAFTAGLQQAVKQMGADDLSFELDVTSSRMHLRLRAYRRSR